MRSDIFNRVTTNYIGVIPEALWLQGNVGKDEVDAVKDIVYMEIPYRAMDFFHIRTVHGGTLSVETEQPGRLQVLFNRAAHAGIRSDVSQAGQALYLDDDRA